jgi:hypothetical protein
VKLGLLYVGGWMLAHAVVVAFLAIGAVAVRRARDRRGLTCLALFVAYVVYMASAGGELKRLGTVFPDAVCERLAIVGVAAGDIANERMRMSDLAFGRTRNRSLLGTLNDFAFMAQSGDARRTEPESSGELMRFLSQTPILPLDGASPIELTRAIFQVK